MPPGPIGKSLGETPLPDARDLSSTFWKPGQLVAEIYTIEKELGRGGMAIVHLARVGGSGRLVAIKSPFRVTHQGGNFFENTDARRRFTREATAWMQLGAHPNVVRPFDVQEVDYLPRIFVEYCNKGTLRTQIRQNMPFQEAYDITAQICWALDFAHQMKLVHRDLKPENILLSSEGQERIVVKVSDFGLVHLVGGDDEGMPHNSDKVDIPQAIGDDLLSKGAMGTPPYMPPEQWRGEAVGPQADIYALGVIMYELFTSQHPFDLATHSRCEGISIPRQSQVHFYKILHCEEDPLDPAPLRPDLPQGVCVLLQQCLEKAPANRPQSAVEVARRLADALAPLGVNVSRCPQPDQVVIDTAAKRDHAWALDRLGNGAHFRGDMRDALNSYRKACDLFREIGDRGGEAMMLSNIGTVWADLQQWSKALKFYKQALLLGRAIGDRRGQATTLDCSGAAWSALGKKRKALRFYRQALSLRQAAGDCGGEARALIGIGGVWSDLGQQRKALEFYEQALPVLQAVEDRAGEAATLNNIGTVWIALGEPRKALDSCEQALPLLREVGNHRGEATTLSNIGSAWFMLGEPRKALERYEKALPVLQAVGDRASEAAMHNALGYTYSLNGERDKALSEFSKTLEIDPCNPFATIHYKYPLNKEGMRCGVPIFIGTQDELAEHLVTKLGMPFYATNEFGVEDPSRDYRDYAIWVLGKMKYEKAKEPLLLLLEENDHDPCIKRIVEWALEEIKMGSIAGRTD